MNTTHPIRHALLHAIPVLCAFMLLPSLVRGKADTQYLSTDPSSRFSTVPHNPQLADAIERGNLDLIAVRHAGWDETLRTFARIKLDEITGRTAVHGQDPVYTVLSMMYEPQQWAHAYVIPVEHPDLLTDMNLGGKWATPSEILDNPLKPRLQLRLMEMQGRREELQTIKELHSLVSQVIRIGPGRPGVYESVAKGAAPVDEIRRLVEDNDAWAEATEERKALAARVKSENAWFEAGVHLLNRSADLFTLADQFLIVPDPESLTGDWIPASHARASEPAASVIQPVFSNAAVAEVSRGLINLSAAAAELHQTLGRAFSTSDADGVTEVATSFIHRVELSRHYPDRAHRVLMNTYIKLDPMRKAAWVYALAIVLSGLFLFFGTPRWRVAATTVLCTGLILHTAGVVLRLIITERMPVSNMYESITFSSWCALCLGVGIELWRRQGVAGLASAVLGFLMLTGVSLMPLHEERMHPLRAVLNSYWLNIHVTMMLASYGTFAVSALFGLAYLQKAALMRWLGRETIRPGAKIIMPMEQIEEFAYRIIQVGWPLLTVGVALGAVWADTAWGRFWGWDPKETWAFITWIVYTIYLHTRMVMGWRGTVSAVVCVAGFAMVMITWLGVSYVPWFAGGLHTYASPN